MSHVVSDWMSWTPSYLPGKAEGMFRREGSYMHSHVIIILPEDHEGLATAYAKCPPIELPAGYRSPKGVLPHCTGIASFIRAGWFLGMWMPAHWRVEIEMMALIDGWKGLNYEQA